MVRRKNLVAKNPGAVGDPFAALPIIVPLVIRWHMSVSKKTVHAVLGLLLTLSGAVGSFVVFLQPWRSCPEIDDSSAGCPATPSDQALLALALFILLVGVVLLVKSMKPTRLQADAADRFGEFR